MTVLLVVVVIAIQHLADAFGAPGVGVPVVQHPRPARDICDGRRDRGGLAIGRRVAKGRAIGGDGGMFGGWRWAEARFVNRWMRDTRRAHALWFFFSLVLVPYGSS